MNRTFVGFERFCDDELHGFLWGAFLIFKWESLRGGGEEKGLSLGFGFLVF